MFLLFHLIIIWIFINSPLSMISGVKLIAPSLQYIKLGFCLRQAKAYVLSSVLRTLALLLCFLLQNTSFTSAGCLEYF